MQMLLMQDTMTQIRDTDTLAVPLRALESLIKYTYTLVRPDLN